MKFQYQEVAFTDASFKQSGLLASVKIPFTAGVVHASVGTGNTGTVTVAVFEQPCESVTTTV